jgi:hypothetical protein
MIYLVGVASAVRNHLPLPTMNADDTTLSTFAL